MLYRRCALTTVIILMVIADALEAQQATVFVSHTPGRSVSSQVTHQLVGQDMNSRRRGIPRELDVPQGGQACYVVEGANPVLYQYTIGSKVVVVEAPAEAGTIQTALGLLGAASLSGAPGFSGRTSAQDKAAEEQLAKVGQYAVAAGQVNQIYLQMKEARLQSDAEPSFAVSAQRISVLADSVAGLSARADTMYNTFWPGGTSYAPVVVLRSAQLEAASGAKQIADQFRSGLALLNEPLCITVAGERREMHLSVKAAPNGPQQPKRAVGDSLVRVVVEPTSTLDLEVGAGTIIGAYAQGARSFFLKDGRVYGRQDDRATFEPAVFLLGRAWRSDWLWGTLGASVGDDGLSAFFAGLSGRFGPEVVGTRFNLGLGLSLMRVPVRLKDLAEGDALPDDVTDLSDLIETEIQPGLGITVMLRTN